ncbi:hypothetical protein [Agromyces tropicus]|uniref:hypothetical protein n=1 Tax=Agromyces tropicus TaxID=555371 RepID=UPI0031D492F3
MRGVLAFLAALLCALAATAILVSPAVTLARCGELYGDAGSVGPAAALTVVAVACWSIGRSLLPRGRPLDRRLVGVLVGLLVIVAATWLLAAASEGAPFCPNDAVAAPMGLPAFPVLMPVLALAVAEASCRMTRLAWWARWAIALGGCAVLVVVLVAVVR